MTDLTTLTTKSALYTKCSGHLELSMAFNAVAAGCTGRRFKKTDLIIILQELPGINDVMLGALATATGRSNHGEGEDFIDLDWAGIWVNWVPNNAEKVCVNEVQFVTRPVAISKAIYGNLTQTDIAMSNRPAVINHLLTNGAI